jgi:hypothetical protein
LAVAKVIGKKREIGDDVGAGSAAEHGPAMVKDVVDCDWNRGVTPRRGHSERVTYENRFDA